MASISSRRLAKELGSIQEGGCPEGIKLLQADDLKTWILSLELLGESLYKVWKLHRMESTFYIALFDPCRARFSLSDSRLVPDTVRSFTWERLPLILCSHISHRSPGGCFRR